LAILKRRLKGLKPGALVFSELSPGGLDKKLSSSPSKAYGRYRRACGVPDGTDFHSYRRNVATILEAAGVGQVPIARFVGQKVGTMAGDTYSAGGSKANSIETSKKVRYGAKIEAAAEALASAGGTK
jgi:integrase